ncbi:MAG: hypothetical protein MZV63_49985 [Marinilabiliales bacterium]|nr:hypothetical protein [Marinilabiliales bacterium]
MPEVLIACQKNKSRAAALVRLLSISEIILHPHDELFLKTLSYILDCRTLSIESNSGVVSRRFMEFINTGEKL